MRKSSSTTDAKKPSRPPGFPLFAHATHRWAKKIRGKLHYFGPWDDPQAALEKWLAEKDDLLAGRVPRVSTSGVTLADLCNSFLTFKQNLRDSGELAPRTFERLFNACAFLIQSFGRTRVIDDLRPDDFTTMRASMAKRWGPVALGNEIQIVRSLFRYGYESGLLDKPVRFGPGFKKPSAKTLRLTRAARGSRLLSPKEIHAAVEVATVNARAMILLGVNAALGNTDLALLPLSAVDLESGWLDYARSKTGIERRIPLWPETIAALRAVVAARREPNDPAHAHLLFVGKRGESYVGNHRGYRVHQELVRVFKAAKLDGRTPYDLRHTFLTVAEGAHDLPAVQSIMGHAPPMNDMAARYRESVDDARLRAVTDHVRGWLFRGEERLVDFLFGTM
jgi:integrase